MVDFIRVILLGIIMIGLIMAISSIIFQDFKGFILSLLAIGCGAYLMHRIQTENKPKPEKTNIIQVMEIPKGVTLLDTVIDTDTGKVKVFFMYSIKKIK